VQRDESKELVPKELSIVTTVESNWKTIHKHIYDDYPFAATVRSTEESIAIRKGMIEGGKLDQKYDWIYDFDLAEFNHHFNLDWLEYHKQLRVKFHDYWKEVSEKNWSYLRDLSTNGIRTILLVHGAVAIGALNALTQKQAEANVLLAAKLALLFSILGIISVGAGQVILFQALAKVNGRIRSKIATTIRWKKLLAVGRYSGKNLRVLTLLWQILTGDRRSGIPKSVFQ